jgi:hypothetical protein
LAQWLRDNKPASAEGAFGLGAFIGDVQSGLIDLPFPYLTLGGALDGGAARMTRLAYIFDYQQKAMNDGDVNIWFKFPVFVL